MGKDSEWSCPPLGWNQREKIQKESQTDLRFKTNTQLKVTDCYFAIIYQKNIIRNCD